MTRCFMRGCSPPVVTRSTGLCRRCSRSRCIPAMRKNDALASGSNSMSKSKSLSAAYSPLAREPNNAANDTRLLRRRSSTFGSLGRAAFIQIENIIFSVNMQLRGLPNSERERVRLREKFSQKNRKEGRKLKKVKVGDHWVVLRDGQFKVLILANSRQHTHFPLPAEGGSWPSFGVGGVRGGIARDWGQSEKFGRAAKASTDFLFR